MPTATAESLVILICLKPKPCKRLLDFGYSIVTSFGSQFRPLGKWPHVKMVPWLVMAMFRLFLTTKESTVWSLSELTYSGLEEYWTPSFY